MAKQTTNTPLVDPKGSSQPIVMTQERAAEFSNLVTGAKRNTGFSKNPYGGAALNTQGRKEFADIADFVEYTTAINLDAGRHAAELARGDNQGGTERLLHSVARIGSTAGTDFASFISEIVSAANPFNYFDYVEGSGKILASRGTILDRIANGENTKGIREFNDWVTENTGVYERSIDQEYRESLWDEMTSSTFWGNEGAAGIGFFIGSFIPSMLLEGASLGTATPLVAAKLAQFTSKIAGIAKAGKAIDRAVKAYIPLSKAQKGLTFGGQVLLQTAQESFTEAAFTSTEIEESLKARMEKGELDPNTGKAYTEESIQKYKEEALTRVWGTNMLILLASNTIETATMFGKVGPGKSSMKQAEKLAAMTKKQRAISKTLNTSGALVSSAASEAVLEEGPQTTIENIVKNDILEGSPMMPGLGRMLRNYLDAAVSDKDTQKAMLLGGLLGAGGASIGQVIKGRQASKFYKELTNQRNEIQGVISKLSTDIYKLDSNGLIVTDSETGRPVKDMEKIKKNLDAMTSNASRSLYLDSLLEAGKTEEYAMEYVKEFASKALQYMAHDAGFYAFKEDIGKLDPKIKEQLFGEKALLTNEEFQQVMGDMAMVMKETFDAVSKGAPVFIPVRFNDVAKNVVGYNTKDLEQDSKEYQLFLAKYAAMNAGIKYATETFEKSLEEGPLSQHIANKAGKKEAYTKYRTKAEEGTTAIFDQAQRTADFEIFLEGKVRERNDIKDLIDKSAKAEIYKTLDKSLHAMIEKYTYTTPIHDSASNKTYQVQHSATVQIDGVKFDANTPNRWLISPSIKNNEVVLVNEVTGETIGIKADGDMVFRKERIKGVWSFTELISAKVNADSAERQAFNNAMKQTVKHFNLILSGLNNTKVELQSNINKHVGILKRSKSEAAIEKNNAIIADLHNELASLNEVESQAMAFLEKSEELLATPQNETQLAEIADALDRANMILSTVSNNKADLQKRIAEHKGLNDSRTLDDLNKELVTTQALETKMLADAVVNKQLIQFYLNSVAKEHAARYFIASVAPVHSVDSLNPNTLLQMSINSNNNSDTASLPLFTTWASFLKTAFNEQQARAENDTQILATIAYISDTPFASMGTPMVIHYDQVGKLDPKLKDSIRFWDGTSLKTVAEIEAGGATGKAEARKDVKIVFYTKTNQPVQQAGHYIYSSLPRPTFKGTKHNRYRNSEILSDTQKQDNIDAYNAFLEIAATRPIGLVVSNRGAGALTNPTALASVNTNVVGSAFGSVAELHAALKANMDATIHTVSVDNSAQPTKTVPVTADGVSFTGYNGMSYIRYKGRWMLLKNQTMSEQDISLFLHVLQAAVATKDPVEIDKVDSWIRGIIYNTAKDDDTNPYGFRLEGRRETLPDGTKRMVAVQGVTYGEGEFISMQSIEDGNAVEIGKLEAFMRTKRYALKRKDVNKFQYPTLENGTVKWTTANTFPDYYTHMLSTDGRFTTSINTIASGEPSVVNVHLHFEPSDVNALNAEIMRKLGKAPTAPTAPVAPKPSTNTTVVSTATMDTVLASGLVIAFSTQSNTASKAAPNVVVQIGNYNKGAWAYTILNESELTDDQLNYIRMVLKLSIPESASVKNFLNNGKNVTIAQPSTPVAPAAPTAPTAPTSSAAINIYAGTNENAELSNFAERLFQIDNTVANISDGVYDLGGLYFRNVEGAFQAAKAAYANRTEEADKFNKALITQLQSATGAQAKKLGRQIKELDVNEWDSAASQVMEELLIQSFKQNPVSLQKLLDTGTAKLTHTQDKSKWGTEFPRILMKVRAELAASGAAPTGTIAEGTRVVVNLKGAIASMPVTFIYDKGKWITEDSITATTQVQKDRSTQINNMIAGANPIDHTAATPEEAFANNPLYEFVGPAPAPGTTGTTKTPDEILTDRKAEYEQHKAAAAKRNVPIAEFDVWLARMYGGVTEMWSPYDNLTATPLQSGLAWYAKKFPNMPIEIVQNALVEGVAAGKLTVAKSIMISSLASGDTLFHEGFHTANLVYNTKAQRQSLYRELRSRLGDKVVKISTKEGIVSVKGVDLTDALAEEYLANEFKEYMLSNGTYSFPDGIPIQRSFFERLWNAVLSWLRGNTKSDLKTIEEFFSYIESNPTFLSEGDVWIPNDVYEIADLSGAASAIFMADFNYKFFQTITGNTKSLIEGVQLGTQMLLNFDAKAADSIYNDLYFSAKPRTMSFDDWDIYWPEVVKSHAKMLRQVNISIDIDEQVDAQVREDDRGRTMEAKLADMDISEADKVSKALRLFLFSVPQLASDGKIIENELLVDGHSVAAVLTANYRELVNTLHNVMHDVPEEMMLNHLQFNAKQIPGAQYIIDKLGLAPNSKHDKYTLVLRNAFYNQFMKTQKNASILRYDAESQTMTAQSPLFGEYQNSVKATWTNNITLGNTLFENGYITPETKFTFPSTGKSLPLSQITANSFVNNSSDLVAFIEKFGLVPSKFIDGFTPDVTFTTIAKEFVNRLNSNITNASKRIAEDGKTVVGNVHVRDFFNPDIMKMQSEINALIKYVMDNAKNKGELSYVDALGKRRYSIAEHTYMTNLTANMRAAASLQTKEERLEALRELGMAPYMEGSGVLMFGNKFFYDLVEYGLMNDIDLKVTALESIKDSSTGSEEQGKHFQNFTRAEILLSYINHVFTNQMPIPRAGSRKIENFITRDNFIELGLTMPEYMNQMLEFFYNEVARSWALEVGVGKELKNFSKNAKRNLFSFENILNEDGWDLLVAFMEDGKKDKQVDVLNSIKQFFTENMAYLEAIRESITHQHNESNRIVLQDMIESGIVTETDSDKVKVLGISTEVLNRIFPEGVGVVNESVVLTKAQLDKFVSLYTMHWDIGIEITTRMMFTDPAHMKNSDEVFKRASGATSTRQLMSLGQETNRLLTELYPRADGKTYGTTARVKMFADEMVQVGSESLTTMPEHLRKMYEDSQKKSEGSDGQAAMTPDFGRSIMLRSGKWLDKHEKVYQYEMQQHFLNKLQNGETEFNGQSIKEMFTQGVFSPHTQGKVPTVPMFNNTPILKSDLVPINTLKVQNFGKSKMLTETQDAYGWLSPVDFTKNSTAWLWPSQFKSDPALFDSLLIKQVDYFTFPTGKKGDTLLKLQPLIDASGNTVTSINDAGVYEESLFNYGIQVETPYKKKDLVKLSTQLSRLLFNNLRGSNTTVTNSATSAQINRLYEEYNDLIEASSVHAQADLMLRLGITLDDTGQPQLNDPSKFADRLSNALASGYISKDLFDGVNYIMASDTPYMELSPMSSTIESNILSIIRSESIQHKVKGRMFIQESDSIHRVKSDRKLLFYRLGVVNGKQVTLPMQVRVALTESSYAYILDKYGSLENLNAILANPARKDEVEKELRLMTGNRIPSDDTHSMDYMEVVEFFPPWHGDRIVIPVEAVVKSGTDFDVDKLTTYLNTIGAKYFDVKDAAQRKELATAIVNDGRELGRLLGMIEQKFPAFDIEEHATGFSDKFQGVNSGNFKATYREWREAIISLKEKVHIAREGLQNSEVFQDELQRLFDLKAERNALPKGSQQRQDLTNEISDVIDSLRHRIVAEAADGSQQSLSDMNAHMRELHQEQQDLYEDFVNIVDTMIEELNLTNAQANTTGAIQNRMNDIRIELLSLPESFENLIKPTITSDLKTLATRMLEEFNPNKTAGDVKKSYNTLRAWSVLRGAEKMLAAQGAVGVAASNIVNHATTRQHHIRGTKYARLLHQGMTNTITYLGNDELRSTKDGVNMRTSDVLLQILNAFLDAEKDPFIFDTGITKDTMPVVNLLLRMSPQNGAAMSLNDIGRLVSAPLIKEYIKLKKGSVIHPKIFRNQAYEKLTGFEYKTSLSGMYNAIRNGRGTPKLEAKFFATLNSISAITSNELKNFNSLSGDRQKQILGIYMYYESIAQDLTNFGINTRFDSDIPSSKGMVKTSLVAHKNMLDTVLGFSSSDIASHVDNSLVGNYKAVYENVSLFTQELFLTEDPAIANIVNSYIEQVARLYISGDERSKMIANFERGLVGFIFSIMPSDGKNLFDEVSTLVKNDNGNKSVAQKLHEGKSSGVISDNNEFFKQLLSVFGTERYDRYTGRTMGYDYVETLSRRIAPEDIEALKLDLVRDLTAMPELRPFVDDLVKLAIVETGMQGKRGSYVNIIPSKIFIDAIEAKVKAFKDMSADDKINLVNQYVLNFEDNHWYDTKVVPRKPRYTETMYGKEDLFKNGYETVQIYVGENNVAIPAFTVSVPIVSKEEIKELSKRGLPIPRELLYYRYMSRNNKHATYVLSDKKGDRMLTEGPDNATILEHNSAAWQLKRVNSVGKKNSDPAVTSGSTISLPHSILKAVAGNDGKPYRVFYKKLGLGDSVFQGSISTIHSQTGLPVLFRNFKIETKGSVASWNTLSNDDKQQLLKNLKFADEQSLLDSGNQEFIDYVSGKVERLYVYDITKIVSGDQAAAKAIEPTSPTPPKKGGSKMDTIDAEVSKYAGFNSKVGAELDSDVAVFETVMANNVLSQGKPLPQRSIRWAKRLLEYYRDDLVGVGPNAFFDARLGENADSLYEWFVADRLPSETVDEFIKRKMC